MKPKILKIKNFLGIKDLSLEFPSQGVFVITGPNGAGKSSILEAIYFALYGIGLRVSGNTKLPLINRNTEHSSNSPAQALVELTFTQQGHRYMVRRILTRNVRGDSVSQNAWFYDLDAQKGDIAKESSISQVNQAVEKVLGLSPEVFAATVFLGQGKITSLIEESNEIRRKTFDSILGTDMLKKMQDAVKMDLIPLESQIGMLEQSLKGLREGPVPEEIEKQLSDLEVQMRALDQEVKRLETAIEKQKEIDKAISQYQKTLSAAQQLEMEIAQTLPLAQQDQLIRLVKTLSAKYRELDSLSGNLQRTKNDIAQTEKEISSISEDIEHFEQTIKNLQLDLGSLPNLDELSIQRKSIDEKITKLRSLQEKLQQFFEALKRCQSLSTEMRDLLSRRKVLLSRINELTGFVKETDSCRDRINQYYKLKEELEANRKSVASLQMEIQECQGTLSLVNQKALALLEKYPNLEQDFLVSQLATSLHPHEQCPVCGNEIIEVRHVDLPDGILADFGEVQLEKYRLEQQLNVFTTQIKDLAEKEKEIMASINEISKSIPKFVAEQISGIETAEGFTMLVESKRNDLAKEMETLSELQQQLYSRGVLLRQENDKLKNCLTEPDVLEVSLRGYDLQRNVEQIRLLEEQLRKIELQINTVTQKKHELELNLATSNAELKQSRQRLTEAQNRLGNLKLQANELSNHYETLLKALQGELLKNNLTLDDYNALREKSETGYAERLSKLQGSFDQLKAQLEEQEIALKKLRTEATLNLTQEQLEDQLNSAQATYNELFKNHGRLESDLEKAKNRLEELGKLEVTMAELESKRSLLKRFSDYLRNDEFPAFYRGTMMREIFDAASDLLWQMSGRQFRLDFDYETFRFDVVFPDGTTSDIGNLSGGEKVLVALSLAFAISQQFAGSMESIFLDEGFAWLDKENNTKLAEYLQNMENGSILVGIVTHSYDFALNFQHRLEVAQGKARWSEIEE
jgi:exonuclease SbcC